MKRMHSVLSSAGPFRPWLLLALLLLLAACGEQEVTAPVNPINVAADGSISIEQGSPMLERIRVEMAGSQSLSVDAVSAPARLEVDPTRRANVRLPAPGRVSSIDVRIGDLVEEGQQLMTVDSAEAGEAVSAYRQATAAARRAQQDLQRAEELHEIDAIPRRELIEAETELEFAEAELAHAERQLSVLGLSLEASDQPLTLYAPMPGRVLDIAVSRGEFVADDEEPVVVVADLSRVLAVAAVPENRLRQLGPDTAIEVMLAAFPGELFSGEILRVSDSLDPDTRTVSVYVELENEDARLRPAMFGTVMLNSPVEDAVVVPVGTVVWQGDRSMVLVEAGSGRFEPREVRIGSRRGDLLPVLDGLDPGDRVVTDGAILLIGQRPAS